MIYKGYFCPSLRFSDIFQTGLHKGAEIEHINYNLYILFNLITSIKNVKTEHKTKGH